MAARAEEVLKEAIQNMKSTSARRDQVDVGDQEGIDTRPLGDDVIRVDAKKGTAREVDR